MNIVNGEMIFTEKFRPQTVDDIILPEKLKDKIKTWIKNDDVPNILLVSKQAGLGKTSLAYVLINELKSDAMFINISLDGNIDTLRGKIKGFVETVGFEDKLKLVILDEFDGASEKLQKALRGFTEEFSKSARFILTANYQEKIIDPLQNRVQILDFDKIFKDNKQELIRSTAKRIVDILKYQDIEFDKKDILTLIKGYYPSTRSMIIAIQENLNDNKLEISEDKINQTSNLDAIIQDIKNKDYEGFRQKIQDLPTPDSLYTEIYNRIDDFEITKRPGITILIAKYSYQHGFARDTLVNVLALGAEIMKII